MLVIIDGAAYAIDEVCSHRGGPLEKGALTDYIITCPWHGAKYDVRTGNVDQSTPWGKHQNSYKVTIDANEEIWIDA